MISATVSYGRTWFRRGLLNRDGSWFRSAVAAEWFLAAAVLLLAGGVWVWQRRGMA